MEEFTFGTLATDELKVVHHRAARRGLQHNHDLQPLDPEPGEPVTLTVRVGPDLDADQVACYYTLDGSEPSGTRGQVHNGQVILLEQAGTEWDSLSWGYLAIWQGTLPPQPEGTVVRYRLGAWTGEGPETFADWPDVKILVEQSAHAFFRGEPPPDIPPGDPGQGRTFAWALTGWYHPIGPGRL